MADNGLDLAPTGFSGGVNNADAAVDVYTQQSDTGVINKSGSNNNRDSDFSVSSLLATPKDFITKARDGIADVQKQIKDSAVVQEYNRLSGEVKAVMKDVKTIQDKTKQVSTLVDNIKKNGISDVNGLTNLATSIGGVSKSLGYSDGVELANMASGAIKQATAMGLTGVINTVLNPRSKVLDYVDEITKVVAPTVVSSGDARIIGELTGAARVGTLKAALPNIVEKVGRGIQLGNMSVTEAYKQAQAVPAILTSIQADWQVVKSPGGWMNSGAVNNLLTKVDKLGGLADAIATVKKKEDPPICSIKDDYKYLGSGEIKMPVNVYTPPGDATVVTTQNGTVVTEVSGKVVTEASTDNGAMYRNTKTPITVEQPPAVLTDVKGYRTVPASEVAAEERWLTDTEVADFNSVVTSGDYTKLAPGQKIVKVDNRLSNSGTGDFILITADETNGTMTSTGYSCNRDAFWAQDCKITKVSATNTYLNGLTPFGNSPPPPPDDNGYMPPPPPSD